MAHIHKQMALYHWRHTKQLPAAARCVLMSLADSAMHDDTVSLTLANLSALSGCTENTVARCLIELRDLGIIKKISPAGPRSTAVYQIHMPAWMTREKANTNMHRSGLFASPRVPIQVNEETPASIDEKEYWGNQTDSDPDAPTDPGFNKSSALKGIIGSINKL